MPDSINEVTFVGRLGDFTSVRAERRLTAGETVLIATGTVEEKQRDLDTGRVKRCDIRLSSPGGRKLASGEMKRPEVAEGRDPRNETLRQDARRKAVAAGLPYYFTCNFRDIVLWSVTPEAGQPDREEATFTLAPIRTSGEVHGCWDDVERNWIAFLDDLEQRLTAVASRRPSVSSLDVWKLREAVYAVADEAIHRVVAHVAADATLQDQVRDEAENTFGLGLALNPSFKAEFHSDLLQVLRLAVFVIAQKLILYRVLAESGPKRAAPFQLDPLHVSKTSTDPDNVKSAVNGAEALAIRRSGDFETAFLPTPHEDVLFVQPRTAQEVAECRVGEVWHQLLRTVEDASWDAISKNLVGYLYEGIVDPEYRHRLGQHYTREDVVDILTTYAIRDAGDLTLDPASGAGSFALSAYVRKRDLGDTHEQALGEVWAFEITAFAAELTTISLSTADTHEPTAYPRVVLRDFFDLRPGMVTDLQIPDEPAPLQLPGEFDAVVGNPPYISYREQTNQDKVLNALASAASSVSFPRFSGKSDEYVWFIAHATQFLRKGGRLAFVVSSAILFSDYGVALIRFIGKHYKIHAVADSSVERWFVEADTNTVLLLLEREEDPEKRATNDIRFVRFRIPLARMLPPPDAAERRQSLEDFVDAVLSAPEGEGDPRFQVNIIPQGANGGLSFLADGDAEGDTSEQPNSEDLGSGDDDE